ncbi:hypothetical protein Leryth_012087 [Lithospermum erythrorhizon]|nr:hypothetical protein Leryth_012087 [Lithospermum erythrorhizon]
MLEQETACFFDMDYFEELLLAGNYDKAEEYLLGFISVELNRFSKKIYFEIRKQKFLEALDEHNHVKALDILLKDLKVFESSNNEVIREMTELLVLDDFRTHPELARYKDTMSGRKDMIGEVKVVIRATPQFQGKLQFPQFEQARLRRLINQSLNWQHTHCANPRLQPQMMTLFLDHRCPETDYSNELLNHADSLILSEGVLPFGENSTSSSSVTEPKLSDESLSVVSNIQGAKSEGVEIPGHTTEQMESSETSSSQSLKPVFDSDFPKNIERVLDMAFPPTSMDFHPVHETLLLVGNTIGDIELWDVCASKRLIWINFSDWKFKTTSLSFWEDLEKDLNVSVNRILWSPDGALFGVAYSKNIVQLYSLNSSHHADKQVEIDAHAGNVFDLAFSKRYDKLLIITCGEDKYIQGWDTITGVKQFTFEGHSAPVFSLCPHVKEFIHFLISTSTNGEIKSWFYDSTEPGVSFDAPGYCCVRMAYCGDGKRLFSCGTNTNGESSLVEWDDDEGVILRTYHGLSQHSSTIVQFGVIKNKYLVAGDGTLVKVWNIDNAESFSVLDVGDSDSTPSICVNKKGTLMAVSAKLNRIKILADEDGREVLQSFTFPLADSSGSFTETLNKEKDVNLEDNTRAQAPIMMNDTKLKSQSNSKIVEVSRCRTLSLPSEFKSFMICRLVYTRAGDGILALLANGIHSLWRWPKTCPTTPGQATTEHAPQLWQPNGRLMMNDVRISSIPSSLYSPCFALSKNDSYLLSASGGTVNLFNVVASKKMKSFMELPPVATCIAIYPPDNNILAIGMADTTIFIYNVRGGKILAMLIGHSGEISSLAFSDAPVMLISAGMDDQIILWDPTNWVKKKSTTFQIPSGLPKSETCLEFHKDQHCFLAVNDSQLAIYETATLQLSNKWMMGNFCARISHATFSCDSAMIYVALKDGIILILSTEDMTPRFEIDPSTYLPPDFVGHIYPTVIAAHQRKPYHIAVGLTDGGVIIVEPHDPAGNWSSPSLVGELESEQTEEMD